MNNSSHTLFALLRLALGCPAGEAVDLSALTKADWEALVDLAFDQGVAAIAVDGLSKSLELRGESLESELRDESLEGNILESEELEDLRYELFGEALSCEDDYRKHIDVIRFLTGLWQANGLETYALKGIAFAKYYPIPEHRYSCDFDCNVRYADGRTTSDMPAWKLADKLAADNGVKVDDSESKHSRYVVQNASVENHRTLIGVNGSSRLKRLDAYLQSLLDASDGRVLPDLPLLSPCWLFNALFCIIHARTHFLEEEGITLKHVQDWVQIRKDPEAETYREQFEKDIDRFGLRKFFDALDGVGDLVEARGESLELRGEGVRRMLEAILAPKDVRHYKSKFLAHLNILRMLWNNRWKYRYYSDTNAFAVMWRYIYGHFFDRKV